jgi:hypothetical protein
MQILCDYELITFTELQLLVYKYQIEACDDIQVWVRPFVHRRNAIATRLKNDDRSVVFELRNNLTPVNNTNLSHQWNCNPTRR